MKRIVLGLVGYSGAGKGTVARYLSDRKSFSVVSLSDIARQEAQKSKINFKNKKNLHIFSNTLRARFGNDVFAKKLIPIIKKLRSRRLVIDGIRHPDEVRLLKTYLPGLILLAVKTDIKKRFQRLIKRKRPLDPTTFAEFIASEKIEKGNSKDKTAPQQQNQACVEMADREIKNNGKIENLFRQLDAFLLMIGG